MTTTTKCRQAPTGILEQRVPVLDGAMGAIERLRSERGTPIPTMVSGTPRNPWHTMLAVQAANVFCASALHAGPLSIGLNCGTGRSS